MEVLNKFEIAPKRYRIIAFFIDYVFFVLFVSLLFSWLEAYAALPLAFISFFLYWPVSEAVFGQTLAKRILKLKVVDNDYNKAGFTQTFLRFIFAIIDMQLCIGLILAATDSHNRRIGDRVANTLVIMAPAKRKVGHDDWTRRNNS